MNGNANVLILWISLAFIINAATGESWVDDLKKTGTYGGSYCNVDVECYVHSTDNLVIVLWTCVGGPAGYTNINDIPGMRLGDLRSIGFNKYKQTLSITKCYGTLEISCSAGSSKRTITLSGGLSVGAIVGIIIAVAFVVGIITGFIRCFVRANKTRVVVAREFVNPVVDTRPSVGTYPTQPNPTVYIGIQPPPPQQPLYQEPPPPYPVVPK